MSPVSAIEDSSTTTRSPAWQRRPPGSRRGFLFRPGGCAPSQADVLAAVGGGRRLSARTSAAFRLVCQPYAAALSVPPTTRVLPGIVTAPSHEALAVPAVPIRDSSGRPRSTGRAPLRPGPRAQLEPLIPRAVRKTRRCVGVTRGGTLRRAAAPDRMRARCAHDIPPGVSSNPAPVALNSELACSPSVLGLFWPARPVFAAPAPPPVFPVPLIFIRFPASFPLFYFLWFVCPTRSGRALEISGSNPGRSAGFPILSSPPAASAVSKDPHRYPVSGGKPVGVWRVRSWAAFGPSPRRRSLSRSWLSPRAQHLLLWSSLVFYFRAET